MKLKFAAKARKKLRKARKLAATLVVEARDAAGALAAQKRAKLDARPLTATGAPASAFRITIAPPCVTAR